jgi:hypothetical protein
LIPSYDPWPMIDASIDAKTIDVLCNRHFQNLHRLRKLEELLTLMGSPNPYPEFVLRWIVECGHYNEFLRFDRQGDNLRISFNRNYALRH